MSPRHRVQQRVTQIVVWIFIAMGFMTVARAAADPPDKRVAPAPPAASAGVDPGWSQTIQENIRRSEYNFTQHGEGRWAAPNRATGLRTFVTSEGVEVVSRTRGAEAFDLKLSLARWGRPGAIASVDAGGRPPMVTVEDDRATIRHRGIEEWFVNDEHGLEHGFTIREKPPGEGPLVLELVVGGGLEPVADPKGESVRFENAAGAMALEYGSLVVRDADGRSQAARFVVMEHRIRIEVEDGGATYPITVDPLMTTPSWQVTGGVNNTLLGYNVASAGDVNGDGYADVLVGTPVFDGDQVNEGRVWLYYGSATGLAGTAAWFADGDQTDAHLGYDLAPAGDVNGDGFSDIVISAPFHDDGYGPDGRVYIYHGGASGPVPAYVWFVKNNAVGSCFGCSLSSAGDVNGDGYSDIIVGAPDFPNKYGSPTDPNKGQGQASIYLGSASGIGFSPSWVVVGAADFHNLGYSVALAGDVNGDGYDDVIVGVPGDQTVNLYFGSSSGPAPLPDWSAMASGPGWGLGDVVSSAGDVNGDGYSDVIIGVPLYDGAEMDEGEVLLYLGSPAGASQSPDWVAEGDRQNLRFGGTIASAGDVNGDGLSDIIIGGMWDDTTSTEVRAVVYLGSSLGLATTPYWTVSDLGPHTSVYFGVEVASAGDVNGDGYDDVIVGDRYFSFTPTPASYEGRALVYYGGADPALTIAPAWTDEGNQVNAQFGTSVAQAGDVNGDGYADVLVGAWMYDNGELNEGRAFLYSGTPAGPSVTPSWTAEGDQAAALFGYALNSAGDVNGDGYSDVVVGAPIFDNGESNEGQAFLYLGSATGLSPTPSWTGQGDQADAQYGLSVAGAGDVNGDGYTDVVVGAPFFDFIGLIDTGRVYLYLGSASGLSPSAIWIGEGSQSYGELGVSVASAGDVDGDGYDDIIAGAPLEDNGQTNEGLAYVFAGSASGPSYTPLWTGEGDQADSGYGQAVNSAGDLNGDGYADIIVGAPSHDNGQTDEGRAYVYFGSNIGPSPMPDWTAEANQTGAEFGVAVGTAGDMNADGYSDLLIGARFFDHGQNDEGSAFVWYGSAAGPGSIPDWWAESDQAGAEFGVSAATAGDVNGDGYSDVIIGARYFDNGENNEGRAFVYFGSGGPAAPPSAPFMLVQNAGLSAQLTWPVIPNATAYDIVLGDLGQLLLSGGDFSEGTTRCVANDLTSTLRYDRTAVSVGEVIFFLVRGVNASAVGSYDTMGAGQVGSRDAGIAASIGACP